ncbi:Hypothetical_protein [Hexamita inflata]|uniref:Hypothetical_protein n=1 Tax=Hexamita inflata TaxID=28002 RepID=A0AA86RAR3_9EUKA|nr:Hypothetical protein HINF_LOCUS62629 [Hexamita inflata]
MQILSFNKRAKLEQLMADNNEVSNNLIVIDMQTLQLILLDYRKSRITNIRVYYYKYLISRRLVNLLNFSAVFQHQVWMTVKWHRILDIELGLRFACQLIQENLRQLINQV